MTITTTRFDYAALDPELRGFVHERAGQIHRLQRRAIGDMIAMGQHLAAVKERLPHGQFGPWLSAEFEWSESLALNMMQSARLAAEVEAEKNVKLTDLPIGVSAMYLLAEPATPKGARDEAIARASAGERITYETARQIVRDHGRCLGPTVSRDRILRWARNEHVPNPDKGREGLLRMAERQAEQLRRDTDSRPAPPQTIEVPYTTRPVEPATSVRTSPPPDAATIEEYHALYRDLLALAGRHQGLIEAISPAALARAIGDEWAADEAPVQRLLTFVQHVLTASRNDGWGR